MTQYLVTTKRANLRAKPSLESDALSLISEGYNLPVLGKEGSWYKTELVQGKVGYVHENNVRKLED